MRMGMNAKPIPAKVGTQPWVIVTRQKKHVVGKKIRFRDWRHGSKWQVGIVDNVDPLRITL